MNLVGLNENDVKLILLNWLGLKSDRGFEEASSTDGGRKGSDSMLFVILSQTFSLVILIVFLHATIL